MEKVAYSTIQRVTWPDGTVYEETIPTLILRTLGRPDAPPGQKFADADLMGIPYRLVIGEKTGGKIEIKKRSEQKIKLISEKELIKRLL